MPVRGSRDRCRGAPPADRTRRGRQPRASGRSRRWRGRASRTAAGSWIMPRILRIAGDASRCRLGRTATSAGHPSCPLPIRSRPLYCASSIATAVAIAAVGAPPAAADSGEATLALKPSTALAPPPGGDAAGRRPSFLSADSLRLTPDIGADAIGAVEFRRAGSVIRADSLHFDNAEDRASARGDVRISRNGMDFTGPELQLDGQRFLGFFVQPRFEFSQLGAGGQAERLDFLGASRVRADQARYTSGPRDGSGVPDWLRQADRVTLDFDANDGGAEGAVLRFLDATIEPTVITRRGLAVEGEYRYLEPDYSGQLNLHLLPWDRSAGRARGAIRFAHDGLAFNGWRLRANALHVSDQDYWKDFPQIADRKSVV